MGRISNTDNSVYLHPPLSCVVCVQLSGCPVLVKNEVCPCVCVCVHSVKCMSSMGMWVMLSVTFRGPPWSSCVGRLECEKNDAKRLCYKSSRTPMDATRR